MGIKSALMVVTEVVINNGNFGKFGAFSKGLSPF